MKAEVPPGVRQACLPLRLPDRDLTETEAVDFWLRDRATIRACDRRRDTAVTAIEGTAAP